MRTILFSIGLIGLAGCSPPAMAASVCAHRPANPLRSVDVFDGPPEEQTDLMADKAGLVSGYFILGPIYDRGRFVTIRCLYEDGRTFVEKLATKVNRCSYRYDRKKRLSINCL